MTEADERAVLEMLSGPVEHDLRLAHPDFHIEWVAEDGEWWYRTFDAMATFESVGFVEAPTNEVDRQEAILSIAWNIAYNLWPDDWTDPWPVCPSHGDHSMEPEMWRGKASWVCSRDRSTGAPIGSLDDSFRRRAR